VRRPMRRSACPSTARREILQIADSLHAPAFQLIGGERRHATGAVCRILCVALRGDHDPRAAALPPVRSLSGPFAALALWASTLPPNRTIVSFDDEVNVEYAPRSSPRMKQSTYVKRRARASRTRRWLPETLPVPFLLGRCEPHNGKMPWVILKRHPRRSRVCAVTVRKVDSPCRVG